MKILITGAGGFIGSHLVESQLNQGHSVLALDLHVDRLVDVQDDPKLQIVQGSITDFALVQRLLEGIDIVYHLASAHLDVRLSDAHYHHVNVASAVALMQAAQQAGVQRVVHCGSVGVLGHVENPPADEASPCHPDNIYERTKLAGEKAVLDYHRQSGFPITVVRPAWVYGPRCPRTEKLIRTIRKGRFVIFGDGQTLRHPVFINDAIQGLELAATSDQAIGNVYIIAGEAPVTIESLIQTVANVYDVRPPTLKVPLWIGKAAGSLAQALFGLIGQQPPFSRRSIDFFLKNNAYSIAKARAELKYAPSTDLLRGFRFIQALQEKNVAELGRPHNRRSDVNQSGIREQR